MWPLRGGTESQSETEELSEQVWTAKVEAEVGGTTQCDITKPLLHNEDISSLCIKKLLCVSGRDLFEGNRGFKKNYAKTEKRHKMESGEKMYCVSCSLKHKCFTHTERSSRSAMTTPTTVSQPTGSAHPNSLEVRLLKEPTIKGYPPPITLSIFLSLTHQHTAVGTSVSVRTFVDVMHSPEPRL